MVCKECSYLNKSSGKCELCGHQMSEEIVKEKKAKNNKYAKDDKNFFEKIWMERDRVCQVCSESLGDTYNPVFFSHILTKGAYPGFRLYDKNIVLKCFGCHQGWEFSDRKDPKFDECKKLAEELKQEYYT